MPGAGRSAGGTQWCWGAVRGQRGRSTTVGPERGWDFRPRERCFRAFRPPSSFIFFLLLLCRRATSRGGWCHAAGAEGGLPGAAATVRGGESSPSERSRVPCDDSYEGAAGAPGRQGEPAAAAAARSGGSRGAGEGVAAVPVKLCGDKLEVRGVRATSGRFGRGMREPRRAESGGRRTAHGYPTVRGPQRGGMLRISAQGGERPRSAGGGGFPGGFARISARGAVPSGIPAPLGAGLHRNVRVLGKVENRGKAELGFEHRKIELSILGPREPLLHPSHFPSGPGAAAARCHCCRGGAGVAPRQLQGSIELIHFWNTVLL